MKYDVDYFIRKFEAIPEENWCTGSWQKDEGSKKCAYGHCGYDSNEIVTKESHALLECFMVKEFGSTPISINDGMDMKYKQPTPKARILAALYDIKKLQQGEVKEPVKPEPTPVKVIHHYHAIEVPESIKESVPVWREN